jgi:hypothetical protein
VFTRLVDKSDEDNERDPLHALVRKRHQPRPRVRVLTATSATVSTPTSSTRRFQDQRERKLAVPLGAAGSICGPSSSCPVRPAYRRQPVGPQQHGRQRHAAQPGRKDNEFNSVNLRISRPSSAR